MSQTKPAAKADERPEPGAASRDGCLSPRNTFGCYAERLRGAYRRLIKLHGSPREIALGFALGLYVGMSPTMGFQTIIAVPIAALLGWNKLAAAMGVWISNPITAPFLYGTTYLVGAELMKWATGTSPVTEVDFSSISTLIESTPDLIIPLVLGGAVLGIPVAVAGYYLSLAAVQRYRERIAKSLSGKVKQLKEIGARRRARSRSKSKKRKRRKRKRR